MSQVQRVCRSEDNGTALETRTTPAGEAAMRLCLILLLTVGSLLVASAQQPPPAPTIVAQGAAIPFPSEVSYGGDGHGVAAGESSLVEGWSLVRVIDASTSRTVRVFEDAKAFAAHPHRDILVIARDHTGVAVDPVSGAELWRVRV